MDRFSKLPDGIIAAILSRLTITEAVRTSILSVRWRHVWRYFSDILDFDGFLIIHDLEEYWGSGVELLIDQERDRFRNWVDQVLKSLQYPTGEGLRICYDVSNAISSYVDGWVQFTIEKKVKKLELDLIASDLIQFFSAPRELPFRKSPASRIDLYFCVSLMNMFPSLLALPLKIRRSNPSWETSEKFGMKHPYNCLKEVKLVGFSGDGVEIEFVKYIFENAPNQKKLLIDPICPIYLENRIREIWDFDWREHVQEIWKQTYLLGLNL